MAEGAEVYYSLTRFARLEILTRAIADGLAEGRDTQALNNWFEEAKVESARYAGQRALEAGEPTVVIDGLEVPSAYSALVRQIQGVEVPQVQEIAALFESEDEFHGAVEAANKGENIDPRLNQLSFRVYEWRPRLDLHGLKEGSLIDETAEQGQA